MGVMGRLIRMGSDGFHAPGTADWDLRPANHQLPRHANRLAGVQATQRLGSDKGDIAPVAIVLIRGGVVQAPGAAGGREAQLTAEPAIIRSVVEWSGGVLILGPGPANHNGACGFLFLGGALRSGKNSQDLDDWVGAGRAGWAGGCVGPRGGRPRRPAHLDSARCCSPAPGPGPRRSRRTARQEHVGHRAILLQDDPSSSGAEGSPFVPGWKSRSTRYSHYRGECAVNPYWGLPGWCVPPLIALLPRCSHALTPATRDMCAMAQ